MFRAIKSAFVIITYQNLREQEFKWYRHSIKKISTEDMELYIKEHEIEENIK